MTTRTVPESEPHPPRTSGIVEVVTALSMTVGRGSRARAVADLAEVGTGDRVLDIGCGPGSGPSGRPPGGGGRRGRSVPGDAALRPWISAARCVDGLDWRVGRAESLPLRDASVNIGWAISTVHRWDDPTSGLGEIRRVLAPEGHLATKMGGVGFTDIHTDTRRAGRRTFLIVTGTSSAERPQPR
jgi:SAM-dependent methyltransferase